MPTMTSYAPGNFCWFELATNDQNAAKAFYSKIFGWGMTDSPVSPEMLYTTLDIGGKSLGALYGMDAADLGRGIPPHWNLYVAVASVDETTKKAVSLGGKIIAGPFDVMEHGRMSAIQDPTGAIFALWQANTHNGAQLFSEVGSFCWFDLNTTDLDVAKTFYTSLFGWSTGGDARYTEWKNGDQSIGGMMKILPEWGPVPPHWLNYILVTDCDATLTKIKEHGGSAKMEPMDIEGVGRFAVVADPQNAVFAIFQSKSK